MNYLLLLVPFVAAFTSWFMFKLAVRSLFRPYKPVSIFGVMRQGVLPKIKDNMTDAAAQVISREILNSSSIKEKLSGAATLEKALPAIETHIDNFLQHKLKEAIPVISMFVGEKIINQLKSLFLEELKELFPSVMSQFIGNLSQSGELEKEIAVKLHAVSIEQTEKFFNERFGRMVRKTEVSFAVGGLIAGTIQLLLTLMILN